MKRTPNINDFKNKSLLGIAVTVVLTLACGLLYALNGSTDANDDDSGFDCDFD